MVSGKGRTDRARAPPRRSHPRPGPNASGPARRAARTLARDPTADGAPAPAPPRWAAGEERDVIARGRRRLGVPILAAALAGSVLAGACSSSGTLPPASAVATPSTAAASPPGAAVVHIDLPEDWQEVEITEEALQAQADLLPSDSPMAE